MKRYLTAIFTLIIFLLSPLLSYDTVAATTTSASDGDNWPKGPSIYAESAIVMEASTGLILYEKNIHEKNYPASITKILSALIDIENSSLNEVVTFSKDAIFKVDLDSSRIGIDVGEQLTMQQSLYGILLESANEVTYAAAEHVAGSIPAFADLMNKRAKDLGCLDSNFTNPHGLHDPNHYTTAYDMALITREAIKNPTFRKIFGTRTYQIPPTNIQSETRYLRNHHRFVLKQDFFYSDCIGGKTGYTSAARYTLATVAKRGDLQLICIIMKDDSYEHQYTDTQKLLDFGFDNFSIYPIGDEASNVVNESPFFTRYNSLLSQSSSPIVMEDHGYLVLPNTASFDDAKKEISFYDAAEIKEGDNVIGTISYDYKGKYVGGADIIYNNMKSPSLTNHYTGDNNKKNNNSNEDPTVTPEVVPSTKTKGTLRPIILGIIIGIIVVIIALYFIFVERPRLKRRNAYYKKRAMRKKYQDDDYLNL